MESGIAAAHIAGTTLRRTLHYTGRMHSPGPKSSGNVTLRDVARAAGVSLSTASRALAGKPTVGGETRARVMQAARDLRYCTNDVVRSLAAGAGERRPIAFITFGLIEPHAQLVTGMERVAHGRRTMLMLYICENNDKERRIVSMLARQRVRGIILGRSGADVARRDEYVARLSSYLDLLAPIGAHLVMCVEPAVRELPQLPSVCYDQTNVVHQAVRALASRGHRRMAFLGAGDFSTAKQRMDGFAAGLASLGLPLGDGMMVACDNTTEAAHAEALRLLGRPDRPTAVVAFSDFVALGVYRAARELGLAIPDDVSVIGFDDLACDVDMTPPLSSIHAPWQTMGEQAARFAMDGVPAGVAPHVTFTSQLVLRGSVGACMG